MALAEEPAAMTPSAVPRPWLNQALTRAAAGVMMNAMPAAPSTPKAR